MKRGDFVIGIVLIVFIVWSSIPLFSRSEAKEATTARIEVNGELYQTVVLTEETQNIPIKTERGFNLLRVSKGGIEMLEADCADQLCVGFGHIHKDNEKIVCLPNRIYVEVTADEHEGDELDAIVS